MYSVTYNSLPLSLPPLFYYSFFLLVKYKGKPREDGMQIFYLGWGNAMYKLLVVFRTWN